MNSDNKAPEKPRILIVEDDFHNIELMKAQLHGQGYLVDTAVDGEEALEKVADNKPDLILLDIMIPKKNGFEVCKKVKSSPDTQAIPVIMVTALKDMESRVKGIAVGADDFLSRPVDKPELLTRVKSMLRIKQLRDELSRESLSGKKTSEKLDLQQRVLKSMSTQLMQASHMKYEFIVNMSHSLRTPLNVIIGFSEMLQDGLAGTLNEKQARYVDNIHECGHQLEKLVTNVVDVFKIDTGKVQLETTEFSLKEAIESAFMSFNAVIKDGGIDVSVNVEPEVSRIVADPQKLATILENILSNAFKFTSRGGKVEVTADLDEKGVRICIADNGVGLQPEECEKVFTEFYKVADPSAPTRSGSGLGLAIAKKLVLMHEGEIWAESGEKTGARFILTLPLEARKKQADL